MRITLNHEMVTSFEEAARYTIRSLRLSPQNAGSQTIREWQVSAPQAGALTPFKDGFENTVMTLVIDRPHEQVDLIVKGKVDTSDTGGAVSGVAEPFPPGFYLRETEYTQADRSVRVLARQVKTQEHAVEEQVRKLAGILHTALDVHIPESPQTVPRNAVDVLEKGTGSPVEIAQVFLSAMRTIRIPARLVFGYLAAAVSAATATAGHPWVEVYCEAAGWKGFDVIHQCLINERYVRVAMGLDYATAAPSRGLRRGGGEERTRLSITLS